MIRYCTLQDSMWVSLNDVLKYLSSKEALNNSPKLELYDKFKLANPPIKDDPWAYFQESEDPFYHWACFEKLYQLINPKDFQKVRETRLISAIDLCDVQSVEECFPQFKQMFVECFSDVNNTTTESNC